MADTYFFLIDGLRSVPAGVCGVARARSRLNSSDGWRREEWPRRLAAADVVLCVTCLVVPAGGVILGGFTHVFTERYVVFAAAGSRDWPSAPGVVDVPPEGIGDWAGAAIVAVLFGSLVYQAIATAIR